MYIEIINVPTYYMNNYTVIDTSQNLDHIGESISDALLISIYGLFKSKKNTKISYQMAHSIY